MFYNGKVQIQTSHLLPMNSQQQNKKQTPLNLTAFFTNTVVAIVISFLVLILVLNAVFLNPLFELGVNLIYDMQTGFQSVVFQQIMNIFSIICNTPVIAVIFLFQVGIVKSKFKALIHLCFFLLGFHFIAILKQAYQQTRPIWTSTLIQKYQWLCPTDFGNPSGHSYVAFPLFQPIISKYWGFQNFKVAWLFVILFGVVVPFSRMYLGVHSMNQVFFGLSIGLAWIVLYRYGLRKIFYQIFSRMLKLKRKSHLLIIIALNIVLTIIPIIIYKIRLDNSPLAQYDLDNLNRICKSSITSDGIQGSMLKIQILQSPLFGILYGLFALEYTQQNKLYFAGRWHYKSKFSVFAHCVSQLLTAGIIPAIVILGIGSVWHQPVSRFFGFNAAVIAGSFLYIWLTPKIERKYNWIVYDFEEQQSIPLNENNQRKTAQNLNVKEKYTPPQENGPFQIHLKKSQIDS